MINFLIYGVKKESKTLEVQSSFICIKQILTYYEVSLQIYHHMSIFWQTSINKIEQVDKHFRKDMQDLNKTKLLT